MNAQRAAFHEDSGPSAGEELLVANDGPRPVDERRQDIESAPTKSNAPPVFQQEAL
jgi:hypothetical protein